MPLTINVTDTVAIASMGDGWADPTDVAATFSSQLEEAYFSAVTEQCPEAVVQEEAPGFDPENWPSMSDEKWHREVHQYYGHAPYWE